MIVWIVAVWIIKEPMNNLNELNNLTAVEINNWTRSEKQTETRRLREQRSSMSFTRTFTHLGPEQSRKSRRAQPEHQRRGRSLKAWPTHLVVANRVAATAESKSGPDRSPVIWWAAEPETPSPHPPAAHYKGEENQTPPQITPPPPMPVLGLNPFHPIKTRRRQFKL